MNFAAAEGLLWDPIAGYTLRLNESPLTFLAPVTFDYPINSVDYSATVITTEVQAELALDILLIAHDLDVQWAFSPPNSLINDDETGRTLSIFGQAYFRGTIFGLQALAPSLFPLAVTEIDLADRTWTDAYIATLETQYAGTWVQTAKDAGADMFDTTGDLVSTLMVMGGVIALFVGNTQLTNNHWDAALDVSLLLVISAKLGFYGLGYLGLIVAICWIYTGMRLFKFPH